MFLPISEVEKRVGGKPVNTVKLLSEFSSRMGFVKTGQENSSFPKRKNNNFIEEMEFYFIWKKSGRRYYH